MSTKLQALVIESEAVVDRSLDRVLLGNGHKVVTTLSGEQELEAVNDAEIQISTGKLAKTRLFAKNVGLFLVSPFIALAYIFALPFVGFYMFIKLMLEAQAKRQLNT
jgi:CheY-like chemotaxis protein